MKKETIYLKVKVVIKYDTEKDRKEAISHAKQGVTDISEASGGESFWSYVPATATLIKD